MQFRYPDAARSDFCSDVESNVRTDVEPNLGTDVESNVRTNVEPNVGADSESNIRTDSEPERGSDVEPGGRDVDFHGVNGQSRSYQRSDSRIGLARCLQKHHHDHTVWRRDRGQRNDQR